MKPKLKEAAPAEVLSATGQVLVPLVRPGRPGKLKPKRGAAADRHAQIEDVADQVYGRALENVLDATFFGDVANMDTVPQNWVSDDGPERATRRFIVAKQSMLPTKDAPAGLLISKYIVGAFAKAKATAARPAALNVTLISIPQGPRILPSIIIEESGSK